MEKVTLSFSAKGQSLRGCPFRFASNTVNYIEAKFDLGENWGGFDSVRAVWFTDFNRISTVLDTDGVCVVPHEVLNKAKREVKVNLVGSIVENGELTDRLTTYPIKAIIIDANAKICGSETAEVTPSQFEQFVEAVKAEVAKIKDIDSVELNDDYTLTIYFSDATETTIGPIRGEQGPAGPAGPQGETGNGIASIDKTGTAGYVDTYTITFTDGTTTTFEVRNGEVSLETLESLMPVDTASGDIASFPDGQSVFPAKSLKATLDPIQDLHGYDAPWVGGAGKNLLPPIQFSETTQDGMTYKTDGNGTYTINGTNTVTQTYIDISVTPFTLPSTVYLHLNNPTVNSGALIALFDQSNVQIDYLSCSSANRIVDKSSTLGGKTIAKIRISVYGNGASANNFVFSPMLMTTNTASSFIPYENICPISGHDEVDVVVSPTTDAEDGNTYTTALGRTVYGGTLDLVSGELTVDRIKQIFTTTDGFGSGCGYLEFDEPIKKDASHPLICNYLAYSPNVYTSISDGEITNRGGLAVYAFAKIAGINDRASFETYITNNPIEVVAYLATPQTYQLTPQQIQTLNGQNNVWSEQGEVEITYVADIQKYILKTRG